ncbi:MAG: DUF5915 domain-containing protein [Candidatus Shikimatogenerans sp. Tser]|uniref:DUF5915 domain-containing protein n=1 Tax=Candidatus Shikimatogenerans sp. Tser TaxID=3158568 RepID=A0AAU7QQQ6_9FLAO
MYKKNIYNILYINIKKFLILLYPITPNISIFILKKLFLYKKKIKFPLVRKKYINNNIETKMYIIRKICSIILSIRKKNKLKVRLPLLFVNIFLNKNILLKNKLEIINIIKKETNIKNIFFLKNDKYINIKYKIVPNYKILGPKYKKNIIHIKKIINNMSNKNIKYLFNNNFIKIYYNKKKYIIFKKEIKFLLINEINTIIYNNSKKNILIKIFLNLNIVYFLIKELFIKDFINLIQNFRKKNNYNIIRKINIKIITNSYILTIIKEKKMFLKQELGINNIHYIYNNLLKKLYINIY